MGEDLRLYEVAAQVIPLLFLALLIERRYFELADDESERVSLRFHLLGIATLSFAGEWVAIEALAKGHEPTAFARDARNSSALMPASRRILFKVPTLRALCRGTTIVGTKSGCSMAMWLPFWRWTRQPRRPRTRTT